MSNVKSFVYKKNCLKVFREAACWQVAERLFKSRFPDFTCLNSLIIFETQKFLSLGSAYGHHFLKMVFVFEVQKLAFKYNEKIITSGDTMNRTGGHVPPSMLYLWARLRQLNIPIVIVMIL